MPSKKSLVLMGLMAAMGFIILVQGIYIGLPELAESFIRQRLPEFPKGFEPEFTVESVGLHRTRIRDLFIGDGIRADSLEVRYAWHQTRPFQVTGIRITGLTLEALVDNGQARINGQVLNPASGSKAPPSHHPSLLQKYLSDFPTELVPFIPKQIRLDHSRFLVNVTGQSLEFPFYAEAVLVPESGTVKAHAGLSVLGQRLNLEADADKDKGLHRFILETRGGAPFRMARKLAAPDLPLRLTGSGKILCFLNRQKRFELHLSDFGIEGRGMPRIQLDTVQGTFDPGTRDLNLTAGIHLADLARAPVPFDLVLTAGLGNGVQFNLAGDSRPMDILALDRPPGKMSDLFQSLECHHPRLSFRLTGDEKEQSIEMALSGDKTTIRAISTDTTATKMKISAVSRGPLTTESLPGRIDWTLGAEQLSVRSQDQSAESGALDSSGSVWIDPELPGSIARIRFKIGIRGIAGKTGNTRIHIGMLTLSGDAGNGENGQTLHMDTRLKETDVVTGDRHLSISRCGWSGQVRPNGDAPFSFDLTPWVEGASLVLPEERMKAKGLGFKTRITRPFIQGSSGRLDIPEIIFQDRLRAGFSARLDQVDSHSFRLAGVLSSPELTEKTFEVNVTAGLAPDLWADAHITGRHLEITDPVVKKLYPALRLPGRFRLDATADAWASFGAGTFLSRADLQVHGGTLDFPDMNLSADGIRGLLKLRDLIKMESFPGQMLTIDQISMGQFKFEKAALRFRVEDPRSLGIENLRFNWCGGLVSSEAAQIPADDGQIQLILYCDRLQMDTLLNQMGAFDAVGGGTLSGRIPVTYKNGGLSFENGFLFSTPGRGGRVYVRDLDRLMAGFPQGTPESTYLEMAGEALKDFEYNWATLKMNSQGDTLNVNMELDGKPARILPFEFKKDINAFVRVDASSPGAHFQGIKLDLNLKLPFNQVTKFGKKIKSLMD